MNQADIERIKEEGITEEFRSKFSNRLPCMTSGTLIRIGEYIESKLKEVVEKEYRRGVKDSLEALPEIPKKPLIDIKSKYAQNYRSGEWVYNQSVKAAISKLLEGKDET